MSDLVFINNHSQSKPHTINTLISFKDFTEYYQYKHKPMKDIIDLMTSRRNERLEEMIIDKNVLKPLDSIATQKIIEETIGKAIEESLKK